MPNTSYFNFNKEDHTLANLLRSKLLSSNHILFAAYRVSQIHFNLVPDLTNNRYLIHYFQPSNFESRLMERLRQKKRQQLPAKILSQSLPHQIASSSVSTSYERWSAKIRMVCRQALACRNQQGAQAFGSSCRSVRYSWAMGPGSYELGETNGKVSASSLVVRIEWYRQPPTEIL